MSTLFDQPNADFDDDGCDHRVRLSDLAAKPRHAGRRSAKRRATPTATATSTRPISGLLQCGRHAGAGGPARALASAVPEPAALALAAAALDLRRWRLRRSLPRRRRMSTHRMAAPSRHELLRPNSPAGGVRSHAAFTLVELLVVIAIIGVLVALLLARRAGRARNRPPRAMSQRVRQLALAALNYEQANGKLPAAGRLRAASRTAMAYSSVGLPHARRSEVGHEPQLDRDAAAVYGAAGAVQASSIPTAMWPPTRRDPQAAQPAVLLCPSDSALGRTYAYLTSPDAETTRVSARRTSRPSSARFTSTTTTPPAPSACTARSCGRSPTARRAP